MWPFASPASPAAPRTSVQDGIEAPQRPRKPPFWDGRPTELQLGGTGPNPPKYSEIMAGDTCNTCKCNDNLLKKTWIDHVDAVHLLYNITDYLNVDKTNADPSGLSPQCRPWVARTLLWAWADRTASLPSESQPHWKCGRKMRCEKPGLLGFIWCHPKNVPKCHSNLWILEQKKLWQIVGQFLDMPIFQSTKMTWWCCEKLQKWRLHTEYFLQEESDSKRWRYHAAGERQTFQGGVPSLLSSSATASSSSPSPPPSMLPSCLIKQCFQKWSPVQVQGFSTNHAWWMQLPRAQAFTAEL